MTQYRTTLTDLTTNDDGVRPHPPRLLTVHTFEGQDLPIERMMDFQSGRLTHQRTGSYHVVIGADGRSGRENDNNYIPWAAGTTGNRVALHVSLAGKASFTRAQWLARPAQLLELARWLAHESGENRIPLDRVAGHDIIAGRGVCGHADFAISYPRETDHTDPGSAFPWDHIIDLARRIAVTPPLEVPTVNAAQHHLLSDNHEQLTGSPKPGEFPGWPQLGNRTIVDALAAIGASLEIDGFKAP